MCQVSMYVVSFREWQNESNWKLGYIWQNPVITDPFRQTSLYISGIDVSLDVCSFWE